MTSHGGSSSSSEEDQAYKKAKKSKKAKKEKKKKKKKEKDRDKSEKKSKKSSGVPERKVRPLSPPAKPGGLQSSLDEWGVSDRKVSSREEYEKRTVSHRHSEGHDSGHGRHIKEERDSGHHRSDQDHHRSDNDHHHHRE